MKSPAEFGSPTQPLKISHAAYNFFAAVSFYPTSLSSFPTMIRGIFNGHGWRLKVATTWITVPCAVILATPSVFDAMTGYIAARDTMLELPNQSIVLHIDKERFHVLPLDSAITEP